MMKRLIAAHLLSVTLAFGVPESAAVFQAFEGDGYGDWQATEDAFGLSPIHGKLDGMGESFTKFADHAFAASLYEGMDSSGTLTSSEFTIEEDYISFLVAGGDRQDQTAVQLLVDRKVVRTMAGEKSLKFSPAFWDVSELKGSKAVLRLVDNAKGDWGFIAADHFVFSAIPKPDFPAAIDEGAPAEGAVAVTSPIPGMTYPEKSSLTIAANFEDQGLTSPTALTFDEKGNIYFSETHRFRHGVEDDRNHLYWYHDDLQAETTEDRRALHKKWEDKLSNEYMTEVSEVIRRLADLDGDGIYEDSKVFADGFNDVLDGTAAGVFYYEGALYFACIPKIYKLMDEDGDGVSDKREVVEEGFGVRISLSGHDLNGFVLGPDGRIYGTVGDRGFSMITKEGKKYHYPNEGALFRFEPDGSDFEIVHTGLRNPKEIAFDDFGNAFSVDNNSDQGDAARVVYLVEGGDSGWQMEHQAMHTFHRQIGIQKRPPSRWMTEKMWELRNDSQPAYILPPSAYLSRGPSGLTYHPGTGFLESEKGRFLICDYKGSAASSGIWSFSMKPDGAGMAMDDSRKFSWGVAATDIEYSFDGRVFISDFVTGWKSHEAGRLLTLDAGENLYLPEKTRETAELVAAGFDQRNSSELLALLGHPDQRIRLRAQVALTRKDDALAMFQSATKPGEELIKRIHGIWGLGIVSRRGAVPSPRGEFTKLASAAVREKAAAALVTLLKDAEPEIRVQALRVIGDTKVDGDALPLGEMLTSDKSERVRFAAGIAIGKMKAGSHLPAVLAFLRENNNADVYLRHAGIYALEHATASPEKVVELTSDSKSPAVRLAAVVALRRLQSELVGTFLNDAEPSVQDEAIRAVDDLDMKNLRPKVAALLDQRSSREWTSFMQRRLVSSAYRSGGEENASRLLDVIRDIGLPEIVRQEALRLIASWEQPYPVDQMSGKWRPLEPRLIEELKPALLAAMPSLLKGDEGFVLTGAVGLIATYELGAAAAKSAKLLEIISNEDFPEAARSQALSLYVQRGEDGLVDVLSKVAADPLDDLALSALAGIAKNDPEKAIELLTQAVVSKSAHRAQASWAIIATIPTASAVDLIAKHLGKLRETEGISPTAIELLAAAESRDEAEVKSALQNYHKAISESEDPLAKFHTALQGGDPRNGASLFNSHPGGQCMRCHQANNRSNASGGDAGPNLAGIGSQRDRHYMLESMILPGAEVAAGYGITSVTFNNGASLGGNLVEKTPEHMVVETPENTWLIDRSDIASYTQPVSAMPPMGDLLAPEELRDLVAWLASLKQEVKSKAVVEPVLLDPSSLPTPNQTETTSVTEAKAQTVAAASPELLKQGQRQYMMCGACHGQNGEGTAAAPPLAGSEWVSGPVENLINIQLRGLIGPIKVNGQEYNMPGGMQPMAYQTDDQIAAVLSYVRHEFGDGASPVAASEVEALRGEVGKPQLSADELLPPIQPSQAVAETDVPGISKAPEIPAKYESLKSTLGVPIWLLLAVFVFILTCLATVFKK